MSIKKVFVLVLTVAIIVILTACGSAEAAVPETSGKQAEKVIVALTASDFHVAPFGSSSVRRMWMMQNLYASLYHTPFYGATLDEMEPWLAKSIEKVDDLTYTVELYDYIYDSKGNHITAEDIVFSYERLRVDSRETRIGTYLDAIEVVDDYNMIFRLKKSGPGVAEFLFGSYTLTTCDKDWYESASEEERANDPATTGAYRVVSHMPGSSVTFDAVENYWQTDESLRNSADVQNVKTIVYTVITESSMRGIALENGEIDATIVEVNELKRFYDGTNSLPGWNVNIADGNWCFLIFLNMDPYLQSEKSVFADDLNLRKAALYALDSESIMYGGGFDSSTGEVVYSLGIPLMRGYQEHWAADYFNYNPERAREYFQASGHAPGSVTVRLLSRTSIANGIHSVIISNLEAVGFKVELLAYDQALFNTYRNDSTQWDLLFDNKGGTGHIATLWDNNFNPEGFANGSANFTHDDHLVELLNKVTTTGALEDIEAFHDYLKELALGKGIYTALNLMVAREGILYQAVNAGMTPRVNAFVFAEDYDK